MYTSWYKGQIGPKGRKKLIEKGLSKIVGQEEAKSLVFDVLDAALARCDRACPVRMLISGPASEAKTTLSKIMADILGIPFAQLDGTQLKNSGQLANAILECMAKMRLLPEKPFQKADITAYTVPPMVILIDEAHEMSNEMQNALLKPTEADDGMLIAGRIVLNCRYATWIMATTNPGEFNGPLATRFSYRIRMYRSSPENVSEIVRRRFEKKKFTKEICDRIVYYAGQIPRVALLFAEKVQLHAASQKLSLMEAVEAVARRDRIDEFGMHYDWHRLLYLLDQHEEHGLLLRELVSYLECDEAELKKEFLPALMSKPVCRNRSLITHEDRYFITKEGKNWLRAPYPWFIPSTLVAELANESMRLVAEKFTDALYCVTCYDLAGNVLEGVRCASLEETQTLIENAKETYKLCLPSP